jgi:hypothetical protein
VQLEPIKLRDSQNYRLLLVRVVEHRHGNAHAVVTNAVARQFEVYKKRLKRANTALRMPDDAVLRVAHNLNVPRCNVVGENKFQICVSVSRDKLGNEKHRF